MQLHLKPHIRASMQTLHTHVFQLAVDRFYRMTILSQFKLIQEPSMRFHIRSTDRNQPHSRLCQDACLIISAIVALIAKDACSCGQPRRQFMERRQVMQGRWQDVKGNRNTLRCTDQMQAPAEELLFLCGTVDVLSRVKPPVLGSWVEPALKLRQFGRTASPPEDRDLKSGVLQCYHAATGRRGKRVSAWGRSSSPRTYLRPLSFSYLCSARWSFRLCRSRRVVRRRTSVGT